MSCPPMGFVRGNSFIQFYGRRSKSVVERTLAHFFRGLMIHLLIVRKKASKANRQDAFTHALVRKQLQGSKEVAV